MNCECLLTICLILLSSRYSSWSSLMCSTILVPRPSGSPLSARTVNEPPADDSHTYCSSSLFFDVTTTLSATR
uniref:Putative secreted protein n=1 Tax=Anopheles triannulatus TaxID=58253 RepID=A0A2M4B0H1_9DIPT